MTERTDRQELLQTIEKYGLEWPSNTSDVTIELKCYRNYHELLKAGAEVTTRYDHFLKAIQLLWTKDGVNPDCDFRISRWTEERVFSFCESEYQPNDCDFQTWWGCASAGKSTDGGIILLTHWLSAPDQTAVTICSTTKDMLKQRIWGEMVKYYSLYKGGLPGRYLSSETKITLGDENSKNSIRGIAVLAGTADQAKNNIIGVHNIYNALCIDEMQHPKMIPAVEAITNLSTGCKEFKFLGMGNPDSWFNPLGTESEPTETNKKEIEGLKGWKTKRGKCKAYDGLQSPGIEDPERFPFLLQQKDIDKTLQDFGEDHPQFWTMRRGLIPPEGLINTVFTESMLSGYGMQEDAEWLETPIQCAAVDPAYSSGGNNCILYPFFVGIAKPGAKVIGFSKPVKLQIEASSKEPITMALAKKIIAWCKSHGVLPKHLAVDTSVQQFMLVDVIESGLYDFGKGIHRVNFGGAASMNIISEFDDKPGKEIYNNRVTELWYQLAQLGRTGHIRGLKDYETCRQLCMRRLSESQNKRMSVESKKEMKARLNGNSPDEADAAACAASLAINVLGLVPMTRQTKEQQRQQDENTLKYDIDGHDENYMKGYDDDGGEGSIYDSEAEIAINEQMLGGI